MKPFYAKFLDESFESEIGRVRDAIHPVCAPLTVSYCKTAEPVPFSERLNGDYRPLAKDERWGELWDCAWFHLTGKVPDEAAGKKVVLLLDISGEACIFDASGTPVRGLTTVRSEFTRKLGQPGKDVYIFADKAAGGEPIDLWMEGGNNDLFGEYRGGTLRKADVAVCRENVRQLYYDLVVLSGLLSVLDPDSARYYSVLYAVRGALDRLGGLSDAEVEQARAVLRPELDKKGGDPSLRFDAVGHAHIDLAWLWPLRETKRKAGRTFSTVMDLMDRYPAYHFGASQPQMLDWVRTIYPALFAKMQRRAKEKRFECQGAFWVEPDLNLTGGESLVRQIYYGKKFFREQFGVDVRTAWLPDVFGFNAALPQLLRQSGVDYLLTIKLFWNRLYQFPYHTFRWKGLTDDAVLVHMPPDGTYNSAGSPDTIAHAEKNFREKGLTDQAMILFGIGDGGGGPGPEHLEMLRREQNLNGLCPVRQRFAVDFFDDIAAGADRLPVYKGELYLSAHQGTYTTQSRNKYWNRRMEIGLRETELVSAAAAWMTGYRYPADKLEEIWKEVLLYQFHDILPGSAIQRVYNESLARYQALDGENGALRDEALKTLPQGGTPAVLNSLSWTRDDVVEAGGRSVRVQASPLGVTPVAKDAPAVRFDGTAADDVLENDRVRAEFAPDGSVSRFCDKRTGRVYYDRANVLTLYTDAGDAWEMDVNYLRKPSSALHVSSVETKVEGGCAVRRQVYTFGGSRLCQTIRLKAGSAMLEFENHADWHESGRMLRVGFHTPVLTDHVNCGIQFGYLRRPTTENSPDEFARLEICAHRFVDLSENGYGAALLNDCKYGHRVRGGEISLNLLRSTNYPGKEADQGEHTFRFGLYGHEGPFESSDVARRAYEFQYPLRVLPRGGAWSLCDVQGDGVVVGAVKKSERDDGMIFRFYESMGRTTDAAVRFGLPAARAERTDLMENVQGPLPLEQGTVRLHFKPFEILTVKLSR